MAVDPSRNAPRRPPPPLDAAALDRLALRYVERFQTTRARLATYLRRKVRERGWDDPVDPGTRIAAVADRLAALRYVDDAAYAESKAAALGRRGMGAGRVRTALLAAGVGEAEREAVAPAVAADARAAALRFARRRRIGPFGSEDAVPDRPERERQLAAMLRAGHPPALARAIVRLHPGDPIDDGDLD